MAQTEDEESNGKKLMELICKKYIRPSEKEHTMDKCINLLNNVHECELNKVDNENNTLLMICCKKKLDKICIKMLETPIKCGFNFKDNNKLDIYEMCCVNKMENVCIILLELLRSEVISSQTSYFRCYDIP